MASFTITPDLIEFSAKGGSATLQIQNAPAFGVTSTTSGDSNKFVIGEFGQEDTAPMGTRGINTTNGEYRCSIKYVNNMDPSDYVEVTLVQYAGVMTVDPSTVSLSYISGDSERITVDGPGTITASTSYNWLSSRRITGSELGFETWEISATTSNTGSSDRTGSVTFADDISATTAAVMVTQGSNPSPALPISVSPSSLSYTAGGQTKAVTVSNVPSGGYSTSTPAWVSVLSSGSSVSLTASNNTSTSQRTGTVEFTDNDDITNTCSVTVAQDGKIYTDLSSLSFEMQGGSQYLSLFNIPSTGVSFSTYGGWSSFLNTPTIAGNIVTISTKGTNTSTSNYNAGITFYEIDNNNNNYTSRIPVAQKGIVFLAGWTTSSGITYQYFILPNNAEDFVTGDVIYNKPANIAVSYPSNSWLSDAYVSYYDGFDRLMLIASNSSTQRSTEVTVYDSTYPANTFTQTVYQDGDITISPTSLNFNENGGSQTVTISNIYSDWGVSNENIPSWMTVTTNNNILTVSVSANNTSSQRTAQLPVRTFTYFGTNVTTLTVTQDPAPVFSVSPTTLSFSAGGQTKTATLSNRPSSIYITNPTWVTVTRNDNTVSITAAANNTGAQRTGTVTFTDNDDSTNTCSISVSQSYSALSVSPTSLSFIPEGETKTATLSNIPSGGVTITSPAWASATREGSTITVVVSSNSTGADRTGTVTITDSAHSSNTCTISVSQSKLQVSVSPTNLTFDSGGESKTVTLSNIPSGGYTITNPTWITTSGSGSSITLTAASYTGSAPRTGTVTFTDNNDNTNTCTVMVSQEGEGILPIWRDLEYLPEDAVQGEDYLYHITGTGLDYEGLSVAQGDNLFPGPINVARIVDSYLHSSTEGLFNGGAQWAELGPVYTVSFYHIEGATETKIKDFSFWNDWSTYKTTYSATQTLNEPINGRGAQNMLIPFCIYNTGSTSFSIVNDSSTTSLGVPTDPFSIYSDTYTGEKVEFKMGADTLFTYDLGYCGDGYLVYRNRFGGWDSFLIEGNITREESYKKEQFSTTGINSSSDTWNVRTDKVNISTVYEGHTGWMTDQESERFVYHLVSSPEVYFKDFQRDAHILTPDKFISVNLSVSKTEYKVFKNGRRLVKYTLTWEESKIKKNQR